MSHRNLSLAFIAGLGLAGAVLQAPRANAADLDLDPGYASVPLQEQKVEFGTGWYIRGDMAVTRTQKVTSSGVTFDTTDPAAIPVPPNLSFSPGSNVGYTASLGAGYQFNRWFRSDVIADFHEPIASVIKAAHFCALVVSMPRASLDKKAAHRITRAPSTPTTCWSTAIWISEPGIQ